MLTADLIRPVVRSGVLTVRYLDTENTELLSAAEQLIDLWTRHVGKPRATLDEAMEELVGDETRFLVLRGLAKLLDDRAQWAMAAAVDPATARQAVFEAAAAARPIRSRPGVSGTPRDVVLAAAASRLNISPLDLEQALYADLRAEQVLVEFDTFEPAALLHRYNLALAQAVLLRAREMRVVVASARAAAIRGFFRALKFHQLMHTAARQPDGGWTVVIDGPLSLFEPSNRYGLQLALALPTAMQLDHWSVEADIDWRGDGRLSTFRVCPEDGLVPPRTLRGTWRTEEEQTLRSRLDEAATEGKTAWRVSPSVEVIDLNGVDVLVPDFALQHPDGRCALVEMIGRSRKSYFERRLPLLAQHSPPGLVLCVAKSLMASSGDLKDLGLALVPFSHVVPLAAFLGAVERVGRVPKRGAP